MRYLFFHSDCASNVRDLLASLDVRDVKAIPVSPYDKVANYDVIMMLKEDLDAEVGICGIRPKYERSLPRNVTISFASKEFRKGDLRLHDWLKPPPRAEVDDRKPSQVFFDSQMSSGGSLLIANRALDSADLLMRARHGFVQRAAQILARLASNEPDLGSFTEWKERYGVDCNQGGNVEFVCVLSKGGKRAELHTHYHLKAGDRTENLNCARIYFAKFDIDWFKGVVILYCGPHPRDGSYQASCQINADDE